MHLNTPSTLYIHGYIYGSELMDPPEQIYQYYMINFCGPLFGTLILIHSQNGIFPDAISKHGNRCGEKLDPIVFLW